MNVSEDLQRALQPLAVLLAPLVAKELRASSDDAGDLWLDQEQSPLGRRNHCRVCKEGRIEGARKVGKKWLVRKSALDAYVQTHGALPPEPAPAEETDDERIEQRLREIEAKLGVALRTR